MTTNDKITAAQRSVLEKLAPLLHDGFYLAGGVALAAHFAHRTSRDLDLFATRDPSRYPLLSTPESRADLPVLVGATACRLDRGEVATDPA